MTTAAPGPAGPVTVQPPSVELRGITKRFPGVVANADVHLALYAGEVHAVVGENGAGKSTLMKTLYGMHRPDEGTILVDGAERTLASPSDAIALGIGMVHQHFMLADNLTVLENIVLGAEPRRGLRLDVAGARTRIRDLSERYGLGLRPDDEVATVSVADRQRVEIAKVLYRGARTLILDEPTAVLVPQEVDVLFASLAELRAEGLAVAFISHKLDEVRRVADRITVIRRGTTVGTVRPGEVTSRQLAEMMVGSELPEPPSRLPTEQTAVALAVSGLVVAGDRRDRVVDGLDLTVHRGEVVGLAGVEGNGQSELIEALAGVRPVAGGSILLDGVDLTRLSPLARRDRGLAVIPEDRHRQALLLQAPLWENRMLGHQDSPPFGGRWLVDPRAARESTVKIMERFDVRAPGPDSTAAALSGGNQQKLVVGREIEGGPRLLVAAHPTRGVDVGAQALIWERLREARDAGMATLLVSADLDELIGLSDTVVVVLRGRVVATLDPATLTPEVLGSHMTGGGE